VGGADFVGQVQERCVLSNEQAEKSGALGEITAKSEDR